jgi:hypothetical protein
MKLSYLKSQFNPKFVTSSEVEMFDCQLKRDFDKLNLTSYQVFLDSFIRIQNNINFSILTTDKKQNTASCSEINTKRN